MKEGNWNMYKVDYKDYPLIRSWKQNLMKNQLLSISV